MIRLNSNHLSTITLSLLFGLLLATASGLTTTTTTATTSSLEVDAVSTRSIANATTGGGGESADAAVSGYGISQTLDFAETTTAKTDAADGAASTVIHSSGGVSNGHQNGMLLMAMLLDNMTNIESADTKPALALFDFNPEDIQDLGGNDFYSVNRGNSTKADNDVDETLEKQQQQEIVADKSDLNDEESLWTLAENPLTMPLVMVTNGQALPGASLGSAVADDNVTDSGDGETDRATGNIYKVKLKRRTEVMKRDRHLSISSRMNIIGNEMTTIGQFRDLISMFDHWHWLEDAITEQVSKSCGEDMKTYLNSLKAGELWALKGKKQYTHATIYRNKKGPKYRVKTPGVYTKARILIKANLLLP